MYFIFQVLVFSSMGYFYSYIGIPYAFLVFLVICMFLLDVTGIENYLYKKLCK